MKPIAEIFSQGEELVNGHIVDSNAAWLSQQLCEMGFQVRRHTAVGDNLADLIELFQEIAGRADCCLCTGGLGPTIDDLTVEAVSTACGLALRLDIKALEQIQQYFLLRQRPMPEANRKQAYLPETAQRIDNIIGTAPGFSLQFARCRFVFLPGVPYEMQSMFNAQVRQLLAENFHLQPDTLITLRSIGIGESAIQQKLANLELPSGVQLGFRASVNEVQTKLQFPAFFPEAELQTLIAHVAALIGDFVFAIDEPRQKQGDLLSVIDTLMQQRQQTLAVLETASMGLIAAKCVTRPWLQSVDVCIDDHQLYTKFKTSATSGNLQDIALELASQLRRNLNVNLALVQLYSGSPADYQHKDGSIVLYNALSAADAGLGSQNRLAGTITQKQNQAALLALDLLRRYLQNRCP